MRFIIKAFLLVAFTTAHVSIALAQTETFISSEDTVLVNTLSAPTETLQAPTQSNYLPYAKFILANYKYEEPKLMSISGTLTGIDIGFKKYVVDKKYYSVGLEYLSGRPTYDGATINLTDSTTVPIEHKNDHYFYTLSAAYGKELPLYDFTTSLDISAGLAYRYLNDKGQSATSYEREQTYVYLPVAGAWNKELRNDLTLRLGAEIDVFVSGKNTSHASAVDSRLPTMTFNQNSGGGSKFSLAVNQKTSSFDLTYEVFQRNWSIAESSVEIFEYESQTWRFVEPKNTTSILGLGLGAVF
jgi:hypothetical protein